MKRISALAAFAAALASCGPDHYAIRGLPTVDASPVPASQRAPVFIGSIVDRSGGVQQVNGINQLQPLGVFDTPVEPVLREAVEEQLRMLGIPSAASADQAPRALSLTLKSVVMSYLQGGFLVTNVADVKLDATVSDSRGGVLASQMIHGKAQLKPDGPGPQQLPHQRTIERALADALAKLGGVLAAAGPAAGAATVSAPFEAREAARPALHSDVDDLPAPRAPRRAAAVVIGVEHYREKLPAAAFAAADAKLAAEYFTRVLGVPGEDLALLTDDRATKSDFEKYFERWLPNRVRADDDVYVYYSGHGAPDPKSGESFLVPYDADPTYIDETGYPVKRMYEALSRLKARRIVVAMDSCFSGAGGRSVVAKGARPLVSVRTADVPRNITVISASADDQISNSYEDKGHGLFTYFFLKGLKLNGGDLKAAFDYLKPEVSKVARREYNADQDPQWRGTK